MARERIWRTSLCGLSLRLSVLALRLGVLRSNRHGHWKRGRYGSAYANHKICWRCWTRRTSRPSMIFNAPAYDTYFGLVPIIRPYSDIWWWSASSLECRHDSTQGAFPRKPILRSFRYDIQNKWYSCSASRYGHISYYGVSSDSSGLALIKLSDTVSPWIAFSSQARYWISVRSCKLKPDYWTTPRG